MGGVQAFIPSLARAVLVVAKGVAFVLFGELLVVLPSVHALFFIFFSFSCMGVSIIIVTADAAANAATIIGVFVRPMPFWPFVEEGGRDYIVPISFS